MFDQMFDMAHKNPEYFEYLRESELEIDTNRLIYLM